MNRGAARISPRGAGISPAWAVVIALGVSLLAVPGAAGSSPAARAHSTIGRGPNAQVKQFGAMRSRPNAIRGDRPAAIANPATTTLVNYHGGTLMHSNAVYAIFWGPSSAAFPTNYRTIVTKFFTDLAHDSYTAANPYGADTQYYDVMNSTKHFTSYAISYKGAITDTHPYPSSGCYQKYQLNDGTIAARCITDAQVESEIKSIVTAYNLPKGLATEYFLFTPQGVASCFTSSQSDLAAGNCYDPAGYSGYCAYHSFAQVDSQVVLYATMHFANLSGCSSGQSPQGNDADSVINGISHEQQETMTDPFGTGWSDTDHNEIADKCYFTFGDPLGSTANGQYNELINGHHYWLQEIWSNRAQACVQRNNYPQPTASFTWSPSSPVHGAKVTFTSTSHSGDGTALAYRWKFGPGSTSTLKNPMFTFKSAGTKSVTLIVTDTHGDQARKIRSLNVG